MTCCGCWLDFDGFPLAARLPIGELHAGEPICTTCAPCEEDAYVFEFTYEDVGCIDAPSPEELERLIG